ncbi:ABC transporter substrate-binding protein [Paenibacillus sp. GCM10027626]|uniref:ABC transporter substrate-binding protein n=1 Tax=Paenibacillus sp. GCM10027626 TaxID=3273411 RepID=UPI00363BB030
MKNVKMLAMLMLAIALIFTAACSKSNGPNNETDTSPPQQEGSPPQQAEAPNQEEPALNMNGETIRILQWASAPDPNTQEGELMLARQKEVEEKYNVKIEWVTVGWGENVTMVANAALSGEPVAEIVNYVIYQAIPAINQGLLLPVDDYFDFDDPKWPAGIKNYGSYEGKMYGFKSMVHSGSGIYYNKTLFEREGLKDPHDLIAEDNWTWESFLDIAQKATKDTDGDGVTDQWGFTNVGGNLARILIYSNNGKLIDNRDGKYVFAYDDPNTVEALHFMSDLFNVHKVAAPNKHGSDDYADTQTLFSGGKAAMVTGELWEGATRTQMTDEQGFVPFPKGPKATEFSNTIENFEMWYMPANVKRPKEVAAIWQELQLWDRVGKAKREGAELQNLASEKDIQVMLEISDYVLPLFLPLGGALGDIAWSVSGTGEAPESALERNKQLAQDSIDANLNANK